MPGLVFKFNGALLAANGSALFRTLTIWSVTVVMFLERFITYILVLIVNYSLFKLIQSVISQEFGRKWETEES